MGRCRRARRVGFPATFGAALAGFLLAYGNPAGAFDVCDTADQLAAVEIASHELQGETRPDVGRVVRRISNILEQTNWRAGLADLPEAARQAAATEIDAFVESRRRLVAGYRNAGVRGARAVMASEGYVRHARVVAVLEDLSDCMFEELGPAGGRLVNQLSRGDGEVILPDSVGKPSMELYAVNILIVLAAVLVGSRLEGYAGRRKRQHSCAYGTILNRGSAELDVTVVSLGMQEARLIAAQPLDPGENVELLLDDTWRIATVVLSAETYSMVVFEPPIPYRTVMRCRLIQEEAMAAA